ncbi:N-acetylmannosamine-6-phosphate 2-epimerase [Sciscionella marina]|uniref:N-acetylmannosamine-6-phosphate 2-epimerase n=1 Tax=Sciscionella marina TaxID=508770 RepID=UPI00037A1537|nr:N-acetylmannosamine-6-phosphate 2-epimerase [Sciscionella marina]
MTTRDLLAQLRGRLIVSCQARAGNPLRDTPTIVRMARAAEAGGAAAIRCNGPGDIAAVRAGIELPVIGLWKDESLRSPESVFITPTVERALGIVDAGAHIVAADGTDRERPNGESFADLVAAVHARDALVMADVATAADGIFAQRAGADCVGTTLSGYTAETEGQGDGPDLELLGKLAAELTVPVIAEGRLHTPEQVRAAFDHGAWTAVVGTAITDPAWITRSFAAAVPQRPQ